MTQTIKVQRVHDFNAKRFVRLDTDRIWESNINLSEVCTVESGKFEVLGTRDIVARGHVPWLYQYWPGGSMLLCGSMSSNSKTSGSTGSGSGFKASQKTGQRLKVSSDRLGETGY